MRERCASLSGSRRALRVIRQASRRGISLLLLVLAFLGATPSTASAATRRIALVHPDRELARSVDLALYPWDIAVVEVDDAPPDATGPSAKATARSIARRYRADAVTWIERSNDSVTLWFFDRADDSLHSRPLPSAAASPRDAAELAAIALTLKTFVRAAPWESRISTVVREPKGSGWESRLDLDVLARAPLSGTSAEPRLGLWASAWYGTSRWMWGAAIGASTGLGMTFDNPVANGSLQDIDVRGAIRGRLRLAAGFFFEPKLGSSAHIERASITTATPASTATFTRVDPSIDFGLALWWQLTESLAWSLGIEGLESIRYQRWLEGGVVAFAPSPLWIQGGTSIAWSFR